MSVDSIIGVASEYHIRNTSAIMQVAALKRGLDQQELQGQAILRLMDAAAIPVDPNLGQNIDIYA